MITNTNAFYLMIANSKRELDKGNITFFLPRKLK